MGRNGDFVWDGELQFWTHYIPHAYSFAYDTTTTVQLKTEKGLSLNPVQGESV